MKGGFSLHYWKSKWEDTLSPDWISSKQNNIKVVTGGDSTLPPVGNGFYFPANPFKKFNNLLYSMSWTSLDVHTYVDLKKKIKIQYNMDKKTLST